MGADTTPAPPRRKVLFICVGNSCRSQLAEAFAHLAAADVIEPSSAGLAPLGRIAEATRTVGCEMGLSFDGQFSKGFSAADLDAADLIVNLSGIPRAAAFETRTPVLDWEIDDPFGEDLPVHRRIAQEIENRVCRLAAEFRAEPLDSRAG